MTNEDGTLVVWPKDTSIRMILQDCLDKTGKEKTYVVDLIGKTTHTIALTDDVKEYIQKQLNLNQPIYLIPKESNENQRNS